MELELHWADYAVFGALLVVSLIVGMSLRLKLLAMLKDMKSWNSNKDFSLGIKIASRVLIVIYWIMKEGKSVLFPEFQRNEAVILSIPKGMNPFAAGMSMFVSLLSAMTIIGLPVEGMGLID